MTVSFSQRELYGGTIVTDLPADFIDASDLRQIPDHQEVFLSPTSLTSIIFEINEYQTISAVEVHSNVQNTSSSANNNDEAASTHHFIDPITPPDRLDPSLSQEDLHPKRVQLRSTSLRECSAYIQSGIVIGPPPASRSRQGQDNHLPNQDLNQNQNENENEDNGQSMTLTKTTQLLIRLPTYATDFCVRVNVPLQASSTTTTTAGPSPIHQDNSDDGDDRVHLNETETTRPDTEELSRASQILDAIVGSLDVRDFGLFGDGDNEQ